MTAPLALDTLAARIGATVVMPQVGKEEHPEIRDLAPLAFAEAGSLSFATDRTSVHRLMLTRASAVIVDHAPAYPIRPTVLVCSKAALGLARAAQWLPTRATPMPSDQTVDASVVIDATARIGPGVALGAGSVVRAGSEIGAGARIGSFCDIGGNARIEAHTQIGNRCRVGAGCLIGGDGFVYVDDGTVWLQVPSFGNVELADDVVLGPACVVDRSIAGSTRLGPGATLDGFVHVGHDAAIGANTIIAGGASIAGAATIGSRCRIGGRSAIGEGVTVADRVTITGMSMVSRSIEKPGSRWSSGWPAQPSRSWWRLVARIRRTAPSASVE